VIDLDVVGLSRLQFALMALYHFLFVPLTLGLSMILVIMESVYAMTGREIWRRMTRFWGLLFGINFAMGVAAGYVVGSVFVLAISAWYLLRGRNIQVAKRSMAVAASFGLACALSVVVLDDESGYLASENQKMKVAAIEAEWRAQKPPAMAVNQTGSSDVDPAAASTAESA
jgi:cytochrome bd-type quinol oxidase subunit 1